MLNQNATTTVLPILVGFLPRSIKQPFRYLFLGSGPEALAFIAAHRADPEYQKGAFTQAGATPEMVAKFHAEQGA